MRSLVVLLACLLPAPALADPALDRFLADYTKAHDFNGTIVVQRQGKLDYARSFGLANVPFKVPNTLDTRYKIASITKAFTAVLILQLRDQGKLDLGKPIKTYLPSYAGPAGDKVTIHQLLNHTSGLDNIDKVKTAAEAITGGLPVYQVPRTSDQLVAQLCSGPLVHAPGTTFDYNNADYLILGKIIERITGVPYDRALRERILEPLALRDTGVVAQHAIIDKLADTYFVRDDLHALAHDLPVYAENWYAAGAMYSTANDVLAFATAVFGGKLVKPASLALMIKPGLDDYGYGVWSYETKIRGKAYRVVKRPGQIMGAQGQLIHFLAPDLTIVILSNTGTTDLDELAAQIGKQLIGGTPAATAAPASP